MRLNISHWTKKWFHLLKVPLIEGSSYPTKKEGFDKPNPRDRKNRFYFMKVPRIERTLYILELFAKDIITKQKMYVIRIIEKGKQSRTAIL